MSWHHWSLAGLVASLSLAITAFNHARSQPTVTVVGPTGDTLRTVLPLFIVRSTGLDPLDIPVTTTLQLSERPDFGGPLLLERVASGDSIRVTPDRPLPGGTTLYWRGKVRTARGQEFVSDIVGPRVAAAWANLVEPNSPRGLTLDTRRPKFIWSPAALPSTFGGWQFAVSIDNVANHQRIHLGPIRDTTVTPTVDLETNASYRWSVTSYLATGDSSVTRSASSFVIVEPGAPTITLLYQNFPNPFPTTTSATTCVWFDLHRATRVTLTVHTIRGDLVRTLIPSENVSGSFVPGRYGRGVVGSNNGCDTRFVWDGRTDAGTLAPTGVYLIRLRTDYAVLFKKALYRGR